MNTPFYRGLDCLLALLGLLVTLPIFMLVVLIGFFDTGSPIFTQKRVGRHQKPFTLIKFRTMKTDTDHVATHQVSSQSVTRWGGLLRKTKIDELPQLFNVLKGDMGLVGPRPCLFNQQELIEERENRGVFAVLPGITGLAQVQAIDMSTPKLLAECDQKMIKTFSLKAYTRYLLLTVTGSGSGDRVTPGEG